MAASVDVDDDDASSKMSIFFFLSPSSLFAPITGEREEKREKNEWGWNRVTGPFKVLSPWLASGSPEVTTLTSIPYDWKVRCWPRVTYFCVINILFCLRMCASLASEAWRSARGTSGWRSCLHVHVISAGNEAFWYCIIIFQSLGGGGKGGEGREVRKTLWIFQISWRMSPTGTDKMLKM